MSDLKDRLRQDLETAMRANDELSRSTIRMVLAAITEAEVAGSDAIALSEEQALAVVTSQAKRRREAAAAFRDGGRPELAEREDAEAGVLAHYLPEPLSPEELQRIIDDAVTSSGANAMKDMGTVMKLVTPQITGRADGSAVAAAVRSRLQQG